MVRARRAGLLAATLVAVAALVVVLVRGSGSGPAGPAPGPLPARIVTGVNASPLFNPPGVAPEVLERHLRGMEAAGVRVVRTDAVWFALEPERGRFDWTRADAIATALARHGIRWWPVLSFAPSWAAATPGALHSAPANPADYGAFIGAFAARYGSTGTFWSAHPELPREPVTDYELWNEPDILEFWSPRPDPAAYAASFAAGATALRSADPAGRAVLGGFVPSPTWIAAILAARPDVRELVGGVGFHPYGVTPGAVLAHVRALRAQLAAGGLAAAPIDVTEVGWETRPPGARWLATDAQRARWLEQTGRLLARPELGVAAYLPYAWATREENPVLEDDWYGLVPFGASTEDTRGTRAIRALTGTGRAP